MEAFRYLLHRASTVEDGRLNKTMMLNGVSRAFFEAAAKRLVCCELPNDFPGHEGGDLDVSDCGCCWDVEKYDEYEEMMLCGTLLSMEECFDAVQEHGERSLKRRRKLFGDFDLDIN